jgi:hypothetical protein
MVSKLDLRSDLGGSLGIKNRQKHALFHLSSIKVDDPRARRELGAIANSPRWAVAYKLSAIEAETTVD